MLENSSIDVFQAFFLSFLHNHFDKSDFKNFKSSLYKPLKDPFKQKSYKDALVAIQKTPKI